MWSAPTLGGGRNELNLKWGRSTIRSFLGFGKDGDPSSRHMVSLQFNSLTATLFQRRLLHFNAGDGQTDCQ